jgi:hypothetical protein
MKSAVSFESRPISLSLALDLRMKIEPRNGGFEVTIPALRVTASGLSESDAVNRARTHAQAVLDEMRGHGEVSVLMGLSRFTLTSDRLAGQAR